MVIKLAALCAAMLYVAVLLANISRTAGGSDSSGYLNEARMLARGETSVVIEPLRTLGLDRSWIAALTPIGFTWGKEGTATMAPGYPPGLPIHMVLAARIAGWDTGPFLVSALAALGCGVLMFAIARLLGISQPGAFLSAAMLLLLPQVIAHALQPVSDVLATFWALAAMACILRSEAAPRMAILAGAAFAIGVWVRPTNILMIVPMLIAARFRVRTIVGLLAGAAPFGIALLLYHARAYGSPLRTGYGTFDDVVSWQNIAACATIFATWTMAISTPFVFPGAFAVAFDRSRDMRIRVLLPCWFGIFFAFYCLWAPFADWWSTRFLLPGMPGLIFGVVLVLESLGKTRSVAVRSAIALIIAMMLIRPIVACREFRVLATDDTESVYRESVTWAERQLPRNAVLMSGSLSGAFFYYTGRFSVRPDQIDNDRFQLLRAYLGIHDRPLYAVLSPVEMPPGELPNRFKGNWVKLDELRGIELWRLEP